MNIDTYKNTQGAKQIIEFQSLGTGKSMEGNGVCW